MGDIERRLAEIERRIRNLPARFAGGGAAAAQPIVCATLAIGGGNTLATTPANIYGIKKYAGTVEAASYRHLPIRALAACTISAGAVNAVYLLDCGSNYDSAPAVTVSGGGGAGAAFSTTISASDVYSIEAVEITDCGSGYTANTIATLTGGSPTAGGSCVPVIRDGKVVAVIIASRGAGYTSAPSIAFTDSGGGTSAAGTVLMRRKPVLSISIVTAGSGYTTAPTLTIAAPTALVAGTDTWDDGLGWATATPYLGAVIPSGVVRAVHDDRSTIGHALVQTLDRATTSWLDYVRTANEDANARGCVECWVPQGVV